MCKKERSTKDRDRDMEEAAPFRNKTNSDTAFRDEYDDAGAVVPHAREKTKKKKKGRKDQKEKGKKVIDKKEKQKQVRTDFVMVWLRRRLRVCLKTWKR